MKVALYKMSKLRRSLTLFLLSSTVMIPDGVPEIGGEKWNFAYVCILNYMHDYMGVSDSMRNSCEDRP